MSGLTSLLEVLGLALVVAGVAMVFVPAAFMVAGVLLVVSSVFVARADRPAK